MKLKETTKKRIRGSVSVLLVIILVPMLTFSALIVDTSRISMANQLMSSAGDLAMNTALANYDTILKDVYGLFAMSQTTQEMEENIHNYFIRTLVSYGVVEEEDADDYVSALLSQVEDLMQGSISSDDFLQLDDIQTVNAGGVSGSALSNPGVLRHQITEYMKYRAPMNFAMGFLDSLKSFETMDEQTKVVEKRVDTQQSTQSVTQACSGLIDLIRSYDSTILGINNGSMAILGSLKHDDGIAVPLAQYYSQVDRYRDFWGPDYEHINQLVIVFLANSPSVDGLYLSRLNYANGEIFIKFDGSGLLTENCGIPVEVQTANSKDGAEALFYDHMRYLYDNFSTFAQNYINQGYCNTGNLDYSLNDPVGFKDEDAATKDFIRFKKFITNTSDFQYSRVATALEKIYALGKYYESYKDFVDQELSILLSALDAAQKRLTDAQTSKNNASNALSQNVININRLLMDYLDTSGALSCMGSGENSTKKELRENYLNQLPYISGSHSTYYSKNLVQQDMDKYLFCFYSVIGGFLGNQGVGKAARTYAKDYLSKGIDKDFTKFMKEEVNDKVEDEDLFQLLNCLLNCSKEAQQFYAGIEPYKRAAAEESAAIEDVSQKQTAYDTAVEEFVTDQLEYEKCLKHFYSFVEAYQADITRYSDFMAAAKAVAVAEAQQIGQQFSQLKGNIATLRDSLELIGKQIVVTITAIELYNNYLDEWEKTNNAYIEKHGEDNFSKQTAADIQAARNEYNQKSFETLAQFVTQLWGRYDEFYNRLNNDTHYKYGSKKIDEIQTAEDLLDAVSSVQDKVTATMDEQAAKSLLVNLYNGESTPLFDPNTTSFEGGGQLCFLQPVVLPIQSLKYLNSAYGTQGDSAAEEDYYTQMDKLTGKSTDDTQQNSSTPSKAVSLSAGNKVNDSKAQEKEEKKPDQYGYTYANKNTLTTDDVVSTGGSNDDVDDGQGKIKQNDDKTMDVSSNTSGILGKARSLFSNLGAAMETGLENAYILTYIFENFSYNTMMQDIVVTDSGAKNYAEASADTTKAENLTAAARKAVMLSGIQKNAKNNYLYGGEIEYILYGNMKPSNNVLAAKASIYAIRFAFNSIYVFTNATIRNSTMTAGLAVQAATCGIVPYQAVQLVLQIALAMAESAIDLDYMNAGLKVAVLKNDDTWVLSVKGVSSTVKDLVEVRAQEAAETVITNVADGLQALADAGADKIQSTVEDVKTQLESATKQAITDIIDQAIAMVMAQLEDCFNQLEQIDSELDNVENTAAQLRIKTKEKKAELFKNIRDTLHDKLVDICAGNELALNVLSPIENSMNELIDTVEAEVDAVIRKSEAEDVDIDITSYLSSQINSLQQTMTAKATELCGELYENETITSHVNRAVNQMKDGLNDCISNMKDEALKTTKEKISNYVNSYFDTNVEPGNTQAVSGAGSGASMIKFGYKDYLMLFTYLTLAVNDEGVLARVADVIQLNISKNSATSEYSHKAGEAFSMRKAYTYVSISATANLDMFFLDFSLFQKVLTDGQEAPENTTPLNLIQYKGLLGY